MSRACRKTSVNLAGGLPTSAESRPTAVRSCAIGSGLLERVQRRRLAEVAQEAQDQARGDPELRRAVVEGPADPRAAGLEGDAALGVRLRVEEDLGMADALGGGLGQVGHGEVVEVLLGAEHGAVGVVDVQERLEVVEDVGATERGHVGVGQVHLVARRQLERQLRLERPFDVHVQLGLGQLPNPRLTDRHGPIIPARVGPGRARPTSRLSGLITPLPR